MNSVAVDIAPGTGAPGRLLEHAPESESLLADVLAGLRARPKKLKPIYFYDALGSALFERICEQPEYYLTRTELRILEQYAREIGTLLGPELRLVELGSGSARKIRALLGGLTRPAVYVPIDISRSAILDSAAEVAAHWPLLEVRPICADFTRPLRLPAAERKFARTVAFFPGSTIGNFERHDALALLGVIRQLVGSGASLLIGTDLVKDRGRLEAAYDDAAGVTRDFNLNVLRRLNREFDANFRLTAFRHEAYWDARAARIEMRLVSLVAQQVFIGGEPIYFERGEILTTEYSHKYTIGGFIALAASAGWHHERSFTDDSQLFALHLLQAG